ITITGHRDTEAQRIFGPSVSLCLCGRSSVNGATNLRDCWIRFFAVDVEVLDRLLDDRDIDLALARERVQRGKDDEAAINLEEVPQPCPALAATEAIGPERHQRTRQPAIDRIGTRR